MSFPLNAIVAVAALVVLPIPALAHSYGATVTITRASRQIGAPFTLIDQHSHRISDVEFAGRLRLVYFGYTHCGDACPLDLQNIAAALDLLGEHARDVAVIFITIDPLRDTPARLGEFLPLFHRDFVGLTGDPAAIRNLAAAYGVAYDKIKIQSPDSYDLSHPAIAFLMDRNGEFLELLRSGKALHEIAKALQRRVDEGGEVVDGGRIRH
jgi:protein SCO1/2